MFAVKHEKRQPEKPTIRLEYITSNLTTSMKKLYNSIPSDVAEAVAGFISQLTFVIMQREINAI